jgi:hypothetical protein
MGLYNNTLMRYNIDNTLDIYPEFNYKRWERYDLVKTKLHKAEIKYNFAYKHLLKLKTNNDITLDEYIKAQKEKLRLKRLVNNYKSEIEDLCPLYSRKNTKKDGFTLNKNAKRKVRYMGYQLYEAHKKKKIKFQFLTLTLPPLREGVEYNSKYHDSLFSERFRMFVKNLKKTWGLKHYFYVVERQDGKRNNNGVGTGHVHFHCVFTWENNKMPHVLKMNYYWLTLIEDLCNTLSRKKLRENFDELNEGFKEKALKRHMHNRYSKALQNARITDLLPFKGMSYPLQVRNNKGLLVNNPLNKIMYAPVDAQIIKDVEGLSKYLNKYITKSNDKFHCRVWGASRELLQLIKRTSSIVLKLNSYKLKQAEDNAKIDKNGNKMIYNIPIEIKAPTLKDAERVIKFYYTKIFMNEQSKEENILYQTLVNDFQQSFSFN